MHIEVNNQQRDALRRMLNSESWALVAKGIVDDTTPIRKRILSGMESESQYQQDSARLQSYKSLIECVYKTAELRIPTQLTALFE